MMHHNVNNISLNGSTDAVLWANHYQTFLQRLRKIDSIYMQARRREQAPILPFSWGAGGAKVPFLNAMICFLVVNMIQRRSYRLKASNI